MCGGWTVLRQRTDKSANALTTCESILKTIKDPVTQEELLDLLEDIVPESFMTEEEKRNHQKNTVQSDGQDKEVRVGEKRQRNESDRGEEGREKIEKEVNDELEDWY